MKDKAATACAERQVADMLGMKVSDLRTIVHVQGHQYTLRWAYPPGSIVIAARVLTPHIKNLSIAQERLNLPWKSSPTEEPPGQSTTAFTLMNLQHGSRSSNMFEYR